MEVNTPKRIKTILPLQYSYNSPQESDSSFISTNNNNNWAEGSSSPSSSCGSPEFIARQTTNHQLNSSSASSINNNNQIYDKERENRRGRPRSEALATLMIEGSTSPSAIKCVYCNRVFPREKSLQAHLRTHTGKLNKKNISLQ